MADLIATDVLYAKDDFVMPAYRPGDVVHPDNVERNGWGDKVARSGTKAAEQVTSSAQ